MSKRLVVLAHGIGNAQPDYYNEWKQVIAENHDLKGVVVKGLYWEEVLQEVADKYPVISDTLAEIVEMCGFANFEKWVGNDSFQMFKDYIMDLLVYVGLPEMWIKIQNECALKLDKLRRDSRGREIFKKTDTILVGHSLGAAMLPHLVWREYAYTGTIPYRGMILLASPLGFESPNRQICEDFMQRMGEIFGGDRGSTLARFARAWNKGGDNRLRFISNENDIVCSDAKYRIPSGQIIDLIPLRQGFNPAEIATLNSEHQGCVEYVSFGELDPLKISDNHDVLKYLAQKSFVDALGAMLRDEE